MTMDSGQQAHPEPVVVASFPDRGEAEVSLAHLRGEGIEGSIVDEVEGGAIPVEGEGVRVLVRAADAERATAILAGDPVT